MAINSSIFWKVLFAFSLQINFSLLSVFSDSRSDSVYFCRWGINLDMWFSMPIKGLSCFRNFGGCSAIIASIFECFGLTPVSTISNPNLVRLVLENLHLLNFKAKPSLSNLRLIRCVLWLSLSTLLKYHLRNRIFLVSLKLCCPSISEIPSAWLLIHKIRF